MEEWKEVRLGDYVQFQNGYAFKSSDFQNNGSHKIVKIKELKDGIVKFFEDTASVDFNDSDDLRKYELLPNDVVFALTGDPVSKPNPLSWVGRVSIYRKTVKAYLNQRTCKILKSENIDNLFLYYYFRQWENFYSLASKATGSASQANISTNTIADTIINLPPLPTQQKIAAILSSLDDKIELNNKINTNLEQQAQALFKNWFVDFEPFCGKMPEGWKEKSLGDICDCVLGGTPSREKKEYWNGDIPWINSGEVNLFRITEPSEYITKKGLEQSSTKLLPKKATVIAITGATLGQVSLLEIDSCANQSVVGIIPNEYLPYEYIYPMINERIHELLSHQTGGAQQHINKQNVQGLLISLPTQDVLQKYSAIVNPIYERISNNCFENKNLSRIRDTLLPKLMNGEIEVVSVKK